MNIQGRQTRLCLVVLLCCCSVTDAILFDGSQVDQQSLQAVVNANFEAIEQLTTKLTQATTENEQLKARLEANAQTLSNVQKEVSALGSRVTRGEEW